MMTFRIFWFYCFFICCLTNCKERIHLYDMHTRGMHASCMQISVEVRGKDFFFFDCNMYRISYILASASDDIKLWLNFARLTFDRGRRCSPKSSGARIQFQRAEGFEIRALNRQMDFDRPIHVRKKIKKVCIVVRVCMYVLICESVPETFLRFVWNKRSRTNAYLFRWKLCRKDFISSNIWLKKKKEKIQTTRNAL